MKKDSELKEIQNKLLEIALFIDDICKKNNIEYFVAYGTCLGAIRHEGFIPWDDDFDIHMTYENYLKFTEIMEKQDSKYVIQNIENDKEYNRLFSKVRDSETTYIELGNENLNMNHGLYIDIFPLVGYPNNKIQQKIYKINRALAMYPYTNMIRNKYFSLIAKTIYSLGNKSKISNFFQKKITKYNINKCEKVISCYSEEYQKDIYDKTIFKQSKLKKFENYKFPVPCEYKKYLSQYYGDYLKIPSKEEIARQQHNVYLMDLKTSYKKYIKKGD